MIHGAGARAGAEGGKQFFYLLAYAYDNCDRAGATFWLAAEGQKSQAKRAPPETLIGVCAGPRLV